MSGINNYGRINVMQLENVLHEVSDSFTLDWMF